MFGTPVTNLNDIKEAVATYTSRAAEKLRRQQSAASIINVFVVPKEESKIRPFSPWAQHWHTHYFANAHRINTRPY